MSSKTIAGRTTIAKPAPLNPNVTASFTFVDRLNQPIQGLTIKVTSRTIDAIGVTDRSGFSLRVSGATRNEQISIHVRKRNGNFELKRKVRPKYDINAYTIRSPELHIEATTRLTPKEVVEEPISVPAIGEGEVLTVARLSGDLAPFIGATEIVTEVGQVTKDFPTRRSTETLDPRKWNPNYRNHHRAPLQGREDCEADGRLL